MHGSPLLSPPFSRFLRVPSRDYARLREQSGCETNESSGGDDAKRPSLVSRYDVFIVAVVCAAVGGANVTRRTRLDRFIETERNREEMDIPLLDPLNRDSQSAHRHGSMLGPTTRYVSCILRQFLS